MNFDITINDRTLLTSGLATIAVSEPNVGLNEVLDLNFDALYDAFDDVRPLSLDLLLIAGIVYLLDKSVPRRRSYDFWTRTFTIEFPVSDPSRWEVHAPATATPRSTYPVRQRGQSFLWRAGLARWRCSSASTKPGSLAACGSS